MVSDLVIIGGGASGFMGAITAISGGLRSVVILEGTSKVLEKVRISGGGRCCLLYTSPSPRDRTRSRMPSSA